MKSDNDLVAKKTLQRFGRPSEDAGNGIQKKERVSSLFKESPAIIQVVVN